MGVKGSDIPKLTQDNPLLSALGHDPVQALPSLVRSRRVALAKRILPVLAVLLLVVLAVLPDIRSGAAFGRFSYHKASASAPHAPISRVSDARYRGVNNQGEKFSISATTATQITQNRLQLQRPQGDILLKSGAWLRLTAKRGLYHQQTGMLGLGGDVTLYRADGTTMKTPAALVDMRQGTATGTDKVLAYGPFGTLHAADGFSVRNRGAVVHFNGPIALTLIGGATVTPSSPSPPTSPSVAASPAK
jgi:lipopolysaccharide export system protein LptC